MITKLCVGVILGLSLTPSPSAQEVKRHFKNSTELPTSLAISLAGTNFKASEPVKLILVTTNITKHPYEFGYEMSMEPQFDYDIDVVGDDGKHPALTPVGEYFFSGKYAIQGRYDVKKIAPGDSITQNVNLRKLFHLGPGGYTVTVSQGRLTSNTVRFKVLAGE